LDVELSEADIPAPSVVYKLNAPLNPGTFVFKLDAYDPEILIANDPDTPSTIVESTNKLDASFTASTG
jgi:hypothetical protein